MKQESTWDLSHNKKTIAEAALIEFFKRMRPGDPATLDNARQFLEEQFFDQRHYDLEKVGRYKLNQKLDLTGIHSHLAPDHLQARHRRIAQTDDPHQQW